MFSRIDGKGSLARLGISVTVQVFCLLIFVIHAGNAYTGWGINRGVSSRIAESNVLAYEA